MHETSAWSRSWLSELLVGEQGCGPGIASQHHQVSSYSTKPMQSCRSILKLADWACHLTVAFCRYVKSTEAKLQKIVLSLYSQSNLNFASMPMEFCHQQAAPYHMCKRYAMMRLEFAAMVTLNQMDWAITTTALYHCTWLTSGWWQCSGLALQHMWVDDLVLPNMPVRCFFPWCDSILNAATLISMSSLTNSSMDLYVLQQIRYEQLSRASAMVGRCT